MLKSEGSKKKLEAVVRTLNAVFTRANVTTSHVHNMEETLVFE
jgi:hypothetical protein